MDYYYFRYIKTGAIIRIQHASARDAWRTLYGEYGREFAEKNFRLEK